MKVVIDCSNLFAGGGIQVALSFLNDLNSLKLDDEFVVFLSPNISSQVDKAIYSEKFSFLEVTQKSIFKKGKYLKLLEAEINPDIIFTVFGPSYHKSQFTKVVGFAIPHLLYANSPFFSLLNFKSKINLCILMRLKKFFFLKNSNILVFETNDAKEIFTQTISRKKKCYVVNNTLNEIFLNSKRWKYKDFNLKSECNILSLTANYSHKNLKIIPEIIDEILKTSSLNNFKFVLSISKEEMNFSSKYDPYIQYIGKVKIEEVPELYEQTDILFMPTLLEVFSTSYLEAMFMKKPIVASDMTFARDICGDAALFCSPLDAKEYAKAIIEINTNKDLTVDLVKKGLINLKRFGNSMDRTNAYLRILKENI